MRIVTINTGKGDGDYANRVPWLASELAALNPDIVACQEVFVCEAAGVDTGHALASSLGMRLTYTRARAKPRAFGGQTYPSESGLALLARDGPAHLETLELPHDDRDGERIAQVAIFEFDDSLVVLVNLHLTHLRDADELRRRQLDKVLSHPLITDSGAVRLVCGDFNTQSGGPVLGPLIAGAAGLAIRDSWELGSGTGPRGTLGSVGPGGPCLDYILSVADTANTHPTFAHAALTLDRPDPLRGCLPSDHLGVVVEMVLG